MEIKTKFDLGQRVYIIHKSGQLIKVICPACSGTGDITIDNMGKTFEFICPNCQGSTIVESWFDANWQVAYEKVKIGKVQVELYRETFINKGIGKNRVTYMVDETGIGSGSFWNEDEVFGTYEEALEECRKRNSIFVDN